MKIYMNIQSGTNLNMSFKRKYKRELGHSIWNLGSDKKEEARADLWDKPLSDLGM